MTATREPATTTETTYEAALAAIATIERGQADWRAQRAALDGQLDAARAGAGAAALAGGGPAKLAATIGRLGEERAIADAALGLLDDRLTAARRAAALARFADDRAAYHRLGREIAARMARITALWAPLRAYEGLDFDFPALGDRSRVGALELRREGLRKGLRWQAEARGLVWSDTEPEPETTGGDA